MRATFGESAEEIAKGIWREVYRLDKKLPDRALEALREKGWKLHSIEEGARIVDEHLPQYREYIERLERIADLLKTAAKKLVEEAEKEGKGSVRWIKGRPYIAYEGPVELSARVEHVEKDGKKYAVIEAKYGDRVARVELDIEELRRSGLLHNLAAIATDDRRDFYVGHVSHGTASFVQAAERLITWAIFMPGEYKITVEYIRNTKKGLSPHIEISSRFGQGGLAKIENSHIHRLVLRLAEELAGGEKLNVDKVLAASWLLASAILNTPDGGRPSEGLAVLAKRMAEATARRIAWEMAAMEKKDKADDEIMESARRWVGERGLEEKYRKALERLRPFLEELDKDGKDGGLGTVSRVDKVQLVGKIVDYDGNVRDGLLLVKADTIKRMTIELGGVKINMANVAEAAAKAFSEKGRWQFWIDKEGKLHIGKLYFGPARKALELKVDEEAPLKAPAFKAMAALITREARKEADELRRKDLVEYVELRRYEIGELEIKIMAAKAKGGGQTPIAREILKEIWREFKDRKYTHLRLVVRGEEYELLYSDGRFGIKGEKAQKLKKALEELGLSDVKLTSDGRLYLRYERLEKLLSAGVEAYAVRKAKMSEAQWRMEITYGGVTMALEMSYNERGNRLVKESRTGKIEVIIYEEGASEGKRVKLDFGPLAAIGEGRNCGDCPEKQLVKAFAIASERGFKWSVVGERKRYLHVYLPGVSKTSFAGFIQNNKTPFFPPVAEAPYELSLKSGQAERVVRWARGRSRCESRTRIGGGRGGGRRPQGLRRRRIGIVYIAPRQSRAMRRSRCPRRLPNRHRHANAAAVFKHPRNVDDEVLEALKKNGGVVGITAMPSIIGGSGSADDPANHVFYIRDSFGPDLLAIGTDALGVDAMPSGLEAVDKVPAFLELLKAKGLSDSEAEALAYRDAKRALEALG